MRDHPRPAAWKGLGAVFSTLHGTGRELATATRAALTVPRLELSKALRRVRAALVGGVRQAALPRHRGKIRCGEECARRQPAALRTGLRRVAFRHRPHLRERATLTAEIVIDRHCLISLLMHLRRRRRQTASARDPRHHLSGDSGMGVPPFTCEIGPLALGMMSKSKMSVGSHSVAQALGISTTPEICPWHGAVPRMA